jgi:hypothetical protein
MMVQKFRDRAVWFGWAFLLVIHLQQAKPQEIIVSKNAVVVAQVRAVNDTLATGQVLYQGLFNIGTADGRSLLYKYPESPYSSHVNVWIDGTVYSNDPFTTNAFLLSSLLPPSLLPDGTISCTYAAGDIRIEQRLKPQQYSDSTGAIFIQYSLANTGDVVHQVGLLLELDTNVNGNDRTPFFTSLGYTDIEQKFSAPQIPSFFLAFEGDPVNPKLIARGTLAGVAAVPPDELLFGDWRNLRKVAWDYTPNGQKYNDSAVILRWNPGLLAPGQSSSLGTYFGLGDVKIVRGQLSLNVSSPDSLFAAQGQLTPNPFDVNVIVTNTGFEAANDVRVSISLPEGLEPVAGEIPIKPLAPSRLEPGTSGIVAWRVQARCPSSDAKLIMTISASAADAQSNTATPSLFVPSCAGAGFRLVAEPQRREMMPGDSTTFSVKVEPVGNFIDAVQLSLWPPLPGVTWSFLPAIITPALSSQLQLQAGRSLLPGGYDFVIIGVGGGITGRDTVSIQVLPQIQPDLVAADLRAVGTLSASQSGSAIGKISNEFAAIDQAFRVLFRVDGVAAKDTSLAGLAASAEVTISTPLHLEKAGRHEIELQLDVDNTVLESNESNNELKLIVEIQPSVTGKIRVRPNPFTPNGDGFNDHVEFDFAGVTLQQPVLHVFDHDGAPVITVSQTVAEKIVWDGRDRNGREVLPGLYLYTLRDRGQNVASGYIVVAR